MLLIQNITIADPKSMTESLGDILLDQGKITTEEFDAAHSQFTGIYRHVLTFTKRDWDAKKGQNSAAHNRGI